MMKHLLLFLLISFASQGQYIKISTFASTGASKGAYASHVIGQSSVVAGTSTNFRQGFKQPLGKKQIRTTTTPLKSEGELVNWSFETFPNPFVDNLTVRLKGTINLPTRLVLYNLNAQIVWEGLYDEKQKEIRLEQFEGIRAGKYILHVFHHGKSQTKALIKGVQ